MNRQQDSAHFPSEDGDVAATSGVGIAITHMQTFRAAANLAILSVVRQKSFDICLQTNHVRTSLQNRPAEHFTTELDGSGDPSAHESWFFVGLNKCIMKALCKDLLDALH